MVDQLRELIPEEILQIFGPPPLLSTEDPALYHKTLNLAASELQPSDFIGWLLVKNLIDQFFEIARYRRLLAAYISAAHKRSVHNEVTAIPPLAARVRVLADLGEIFEELRELESRRAAEAQANGISPEAAAAGPTELDFAGTLPEWIREYQQLTYLLRAAEKRLSETRSEIDQHYRGLGKMLRENFDRTIEAEVKPQPAPERRELVLRTGHKVKGSGPRSPSLISKRKRRGSEAQEGLR
jgi:hypothetical protein